MTPEKQRIAIATALGWTGFIPSNIAQEFDVTGTPPDWSGARYHRVPDYLNDLNAMREVESQFLLGGKFETKPMIYLNELEIIRNREGQDWSKPSMTLELFFVMATAAQRSEAFLKCLGLWTDSNDEHSPIHEQPTQLPHL